MYFVNLTRKFSAYVIYCVYGNEWSWEILWCTNFVKTSYLTQEFRLDLSRAMNGILGLKRMFSILGEFTGYYTFSHFHQHCWL